MTLPATFPVRLDTPLSRVDPRWKLAALVPAAAVTGSLLNAGPALAALGGAFVVVGLARVPARWFAQRIGLLVLFLGLFLVFLPFLEDNAEQRWQLGPLSLSPHGLVFAVVLLIKAVALVSLLVAAATTAPTDVYLKALHALRVPRLVVQISALTVRYLAVVLEEFGTMRVALRVRGYRQRATLGSLRTVGHVAGMLVVRASERAERVAQALRCRGFDGRFQSLTAFQTRGADVLFFADVILAAAGILAWDLFERSN
jgi:cobalt/nickel transport system permease protein